MKPTELETLLGADPRQREQGTRKAVGADPAHLAAARAAADFEDRLESAFDIDVDEVFLERLKARRPRVPKASPAWLALAASIVVAAGASTVAWQHWQTPRDIPLYVERHFGHDGEHLFRRAADTADSAETAEVLASLGVRATPELHSMVRVIKHCPTPGGKGAHMVLDTDQGPVQVIFMPGSRVEEGAEFAFGRVNAVLVAVPEGALAVISPSKQSLAGLGRALHDSILPLTART